MDILLLRWATCFERRWSSIPSKRRKLSNVVSLVLEFNCLLGSLLLSCLNAADASNFSGFLFALLLQLKWYLFELDAFETGRVGIHFSFKVPAIDTHNSASTHQNRPNIAHIAPRWCRNVQSLVRLFLFSLEDFTDVRVDSWFVFLINISVLTFVLLFARICRHHDQVSHLFALARV